MRNCKPPTLRLSRASRATYGSGLYATACSITMRDNSIASKARYALTDDSMYRLDTSSGEWARVVSAAAGALTNRNISALALGRGGRLWVGYFDRGLDIMEPDHERVAHLEDDHLFCINRIVQE